MFSALTYKLYELSEFSHSHNYPDTNKQNSFAIVTSNDIPLQTACPFPIHLHYPTFIMFADNMHEVKCLFKEMAVNTDVSSGSL